MKNADGSGSCDANGKGLTAEPQQLPVELDAGRIREIENLI